jgi:ribosome biogenesis protein MAK21
MYLNLLFRSLREDKGAHKTGRTKAFVKRFLQVLIGAGDGGAEFVAGGLYLLGEVSRCCY